MDVTRERLFTPRFFLMCGFSFTVFLSAFQLFPTAPFRIRDLGGDTFAAGLFLACLTFASAVSAPVHRGAGRPVRPAPDAPRRRRRTDASSRSATPCCRTTA